ncbi:alpha/beta hydrolase [Antribacter sp. KLBMP9083]|uniref:Alpha/beta hydrolase n=1 Tax=Antribacter soli TaxID=2910976 RepID=A0AA41U6C1_9MICO|nr:alpha/beta hydrolase [Antribacter soli]MCF4120150.1 alpha/beta hydrolase [Antribacter soli]
MPIQSPLPSPFATLVARTPVRVDEVVLRGAPTRVWVYGAPDAAHRVVFLHGFRGDHHGLEPIVANLANRSGTSGDGADIQVVVPDLPGFGASPRFGDGPHDVAGYARWTRDLLAAVAPDGDAVLAGHSFGSIVAAAALAGTAVGPLGTAVGPTTDAAPPVRALMLVNPIPVPALTGPNALATRGTVVLHRLAGALPERAGTCLLRHPLLTRVASVAMVTTRDRTLRRWIHEEHDRYFAGFADRRTLLESFGASVTGTVATWAARVPVPTLLVGGDSDDLAPLAAQHDLAAVFRDARLVVLPGVGHLTHYEAPTAVAEALRDFLGVPTCGLVAPGDLVATPEGAA